MSRALLAPALTLGCVHTAVVPVCETHATPVADDEPTAVGTVAELLARVVGAGEAPAELEDGSPVLARWAVARGPGGAELVEQTGIYVEERSFGWPGTTDLLMSPVCSAWLRVPVELDLATDDGSFVLSQRGRGYTEGHVVHPAPHVEVDVPFDATGLDDPPDLEPLDWTDERAFARVVFSDDGTTIGRAGWTGRVEDREDSRALLRWW